MPRLWWRRPHARPDSPFAFATAAAALLASALLSGCASPGPPRPPSLQLPRLVSDLTATRSGDAVVLRFTVPARTTDGQPLRAGTVAGGLCRQLAKGGPCTPVDTEETRTPLPVPTSTSPMPVTWTDPLPPALRTGAPRAISYRIELRNGAGRSAGPSDPVYAAAGMSPPTIVGLEAEGTRLGVELTWQPVANAGEVLLERSEPVTTRPRPEKPVAAPARGRPGKAAHVSSNSGASDHKSHAEPGVVWLQAAPGDRGAARTMDASVVEGVPYRYLAVRRETVQIGGRTLELRSAPTTVVTVTWHDVYPPPAPTGLTALGYTVPETRSDAQPQSAPVPQGATTPATPPATKATYAVDLIWQPVDDVRLAGYVVYRQRLGTGGEPAGNREKLTPQPVPVPGFHDPTALPGVRYRYSVTAIDPKGNESAPVEAVVEPSVAP